MLNLYRIDDRKRIDMKLLMKIFSVVLVVALVSVIVFGFFLETSDVPEFVVQLLAWLIEIAFPILIVAFSCYSVQIKDSGISVRIILSIMIFAVILSACRTFIPLYDINETLSDVVNWISSFIGQAYLYIFAYVLLSLVKPNNAICNIIKKIAYGALIVCIIVQIYMYIKITLVDKLPNVYGYGGFNFTTVVEDQIFVAKVALGAIIVEVFAIVLAFITNYAFEVETIESDVIDYDLLKKQADNMTQNRIYDMYTAPVTVQSAGPDRSASEQGLMNVNNQIGNNSNVGQVKEAAKQSIIDANIPTSSGPVVNSAVNQPVAPTTPAPAAPAQAVTQPAAQPVANQPIQK